MKKIYHISLLGVAMFLACTSKIHAISYTWNGSVSQLWSNNANWTPSTGVPGPTDDITINGAGGANQPLFEELPGVRNITITGGILDLDGFFLTSSGTCVFSGGQIRNGTLTMTGTSVLFSGTLVNVSVIYTGNYIRFNGSVFNNPVTVNKTGGTNDVSNGGNTFNSTFSFTNSSNRYQYMSNVSADTYNGVVTLTNSNSGGIYMSNVALNNNYNQNIIVNSTSTTGIRFGNGGGSSTLASGRTISVGTAFTNGDLTLRRFTQLGGGLITLTGATSGRVLFETGSVFNARISADFPFVLLNGSTFNDTCRIRKTGSGNLTNNGGNVFNGITYISTDGNGSYDMANTSPDIFNNDLYMDDNNGSGGIGLARVAAGNQFNGNVYINCNSAGGVYWGQGGGTSMLASGKIIGLWNDGFPQGSMLIRGLTQVGTTTPISFTQTIGTGIIQFETGNIFNAPVNITFPNINLNGTRFNNTVQFDKRSASAIASNGGNRFDGATTFILTGNGTWTLQNVSPDIFNSTLSLDNNATTAALALSATGIGNQLNGELKINNSSTGGISFGSNAGTTTLSTGNTISLFNDGVTTGTITFRNFTQSGTGTISLSQTTGTGALAFGPNSAWSADLTYTFPGCTFNTSTFAGALTISKSTGGAFVSNGGNTFNGAFSFTNTSAGNITLGNVAVDIFNGPVSINNSGTSNFYIAHTATGHQFNNTVTLNSTGTSLGIRFGQNGGRSTLLAPNIISAPSVTSGGIMIRGLTKAGTEAMSFTATGAATLIQFETLNNISGDVTIDASNIQFNGTTFNGNVIVNKTVNSASTSNGGNTFNGNFTFTNTTSGQVVMGNVSADIFNGTVTINNSGTNTFFLAQTGAGHQFNNTVTLNSTGTSSGIRFGQGNGTSTINSSYSISMPSITSGSMIFRGITKANTDPMTISASGAATLIQFETNNNISGDLTITTPGILFNGSTFNGNVSVIKTAASTNLSNGGNTFNGNFSYNSTVNGTITMASISRDIFNGNVILENNSTSGVINMSNFGATNQINGNLSVSCTSTGGISFGAGGGLTAIPNGSILIGVGGFTAGPLNLRGITKSSNTDLNFTQATGSATLAFLQSSDITGNVTATFPNFTLDRTRFRGNLTMIKTVATANNNYGGCTFDGNVSITNTTAGQFCFGFTAADIFNGNLSLSNSGAAIMYVAYAGAGHQFNGNIILNSTGTSLGIQFGQGNGGSTLADGRTIQIGGSGHTAGTMRIRNFIQTGTTSQSLTLTGTSVAYFETGNRFEGPFTFVAPQVYLNGTRFNLDATISQNGTAGIISNGGNSFFGATTLNLSGSGSWTLGNVNPDLFQGTLAINSSGSGLFSLSNTGTLHNFAGNVTLSSTGTSQGIRFGQGGGTSTLVSGASFSIGGAGFTSGTLRLRGMTQNGTGTPISLTFATANTGLYLETNNIFNASVSVSANLLFLNGTRFNNDASLTQTGTTITSSNGGNIFNGTTLLRATGLGEFRLATVSNDTYTGSVTFNQTSALTLYPAYTANALINGNLSTVGTTQPITFSPVAGAARVIFGGTNQQVSGSAVLAPIIKNITLNLSSGNLTLNVPLTITNNITFTNGDLVSSLTNLLILNDNVTVTSVSDASHVNGVVRKVGNDAFTFPLGNGAIYRPIGITAPGVITDHFTAQYINSDPDALYSRSNKDASINNISICEYWILNRTNGASSVSVNLSWASNSCGVGNSATLQVCRWNGTTWKDHGNGGTFNAGGINFLSTSGVVSSFSPFTLGSQNNENPLPIELLYFEAKQTDKKVVLDWVTASESNNHFFQVERSKDAINYEIVGILSGAGNSNQQKKYSITDNDPLKGISYYKLVQTDFNGEIEEFGPEMVEFKLGIIEPEIYPNPFTDKLSINLNGLEVNSNNIQIVDLSGRSIQGWNITSQSYFNTEINTKELPSGIYMLKIMMGKTIITKRIIRH
jgi:hypothetical protein